MDHQFCPGAKILRQPKPEIFTCPRCGEEVEIWSDERKGKCLHCGKIVLREEHGSCLDWCEFGKECVGEEAYNRYMTRRAESLKEKLFNELDRIIEERREAGNKNGEGSDQDDTQTVNARKTDARRLVEYTERLAKREDGDLHIVISAAILSTITDGPINDNTDDLTKLLLKQGLQVETINNIVDVIRMVHVERKGRSNGSTEIETETTSKNAEVVCDAYRLMSFEQKIENEEISPKELEQAAGKKAATDKKGATDEKAPTDKKGATDKKAAVIEKERFSTDTAGDLAEDIVDEVLSKKRPKQ